MGTPRVLILGHSFIRRLHDFIESDSGHLDLTFHLSASALISWHGIGGRTIAKTVKFDLHILHSFRPDIVIVQLGTNDLTSCPPLQVGSALEDFVHLLHDSYGPVSDPQSPTRRLTIYYLCSFLLGAKFLTPPFLKRF